MPGLGGHAYALAAQRGSGGAVAVGCGDHTVRLWRPPGGAGGEVGKAGGGEGGKAGGGVAAAPDSELLWQVGM